MADIVQFPSGAQRDVRIVEYCTREGLIDSGIPPQDAAAVAELVSLAWKSIAQAGGDLGAVYDAAHRELMHLAFKVVRGQS